MPNASIINSMASEIEQEIVKSPSQFGFEDDDFDDD